MVEPAGPPPGPGARLRVETTCGDDLITGEVPLDESGPFEVEHPFFNYGPCTVRSVRLITQDHELVLPTSRWGDYSVGPDQVSAPWPVGDRFTTPGTDSLGAGLTVR